MAWAILILAGVFEIIWAYSMKMSEGFTRLTPSVITVVFMILSVVLLSISMKTLPLGTAYTVWTGIGAIGSFLVGIFFLHEPICNENDCRCTDCIGTGSNENFVSILKG